ncbi:coiled-coil domain-containing protein 178-like [Ruditapes philippinarum]|uniref:coiled-coil domain-containing protein 178-like n=1 Tax=Ruditapes philippinarum TaxID=129788 RepID=UPI00295B94F8|nr:coiled-coil domain-containing protein 178-like [Ruditapes philippinarum]XP_060608580.1 coiled-coil domain-containing protein 178-like [Ruditapes philippinarum]
MASKVVKVEQVHGLHGGRKDKHNPFDRSKTNQTASTELLAYGTDSSVLPLSRQDEDSFEVEVGDEAQDKLYPLPENWPKLPQIFRRRSCELTTTTAPCVNKAVSHLELLQNVIEDWSQEKEEEIKSRQATARTSRKDVRFTETRESSRGGLVSASSNSSSQRSQPLSIQGLGFKEETKEIPVDMSVPYLGAEQAVEEVLTLLARLENDRQETENALTREKERVIRLGAKIDFHCQRRMKELPVVVQKEHEECIMDINELQWHVAYSSRNEARIQDRVDIAEVLNKRLKEDIEFVKKHIPLVEEKLELELEAMTKIRNAQRDTNQELDNTKNRQEKTEAKSNEATNKAEKERGHIKKELDFVREALSAINEELSEAKMTFNAYNHQINDITQQLKDNEQELKVLEVKTENAKVAVEMQEAKVKDVGNKIEESEFEHARLDSENAKLASDLKVKKQHYGEVIGELENAVKKRDSRLRQVGLKNQEVKMEVQDYMDKKNECQRIKDSDEKNIRRIHKEMDKIKQQLDITMEEYNRVAVINTTIRDQLVAEQDKTHRMEESLKVTADTLRRQVKDEVHTKSVLSARISSDTEDLKKSRGDIREKKNKAAKVADDVVTAVKNVKEKVEKLRSAKENKTRQKRDLSARRVETIKQMEESEKRFDERIKQIQPHHAHLKEDLLKVSRRLDHMEWKADMMKNKMDDMDKSQGMMDRLVGNTTKALETLNDQIEELELQIEAAQKIEDDLKGQFSDIQLRVRNNESSHRKFLESRKVVLRELEEEKNKAINANQELASRYRTLQNNHMEVKDKLMNNFEDRVKMENAIKDVRELQALQIRMHGAMMEYYKYRGLYNSAELSRMEDLSIKNSEKVIELQDSMDKALRNISDFLQTQMTGEAIKKTAWDNVQKQQKRAAAKQARKDIKMRTSSTIQVAS